MAPCTFMATSQAPLANPSRTKPMTTGTTPTVYPTATTPSATASSTDITATVSLDPKRCTMMPAIGSATSEPTAIASSTNPRCCGLSPSSSRICGMRDAQVAVATPAPMNAAYVARVATDTSARCGATVCTHTPL